MNKKKQHTKPPRSNEKGRSPVCVGAKLRPVGRLFCFYPPPFGFFCCCFFFFLAGGLVQHRLSCCRLFFTFLFFCGFSFFFFLESMSGTSLFECFSPRSTVSVRWCLCGDCVQTERSWNPAPNPQKPPPPPPQRPFAECVLCDRESSHFRFY